MPLLACLLATNTFILYMGHKISDVHNHAPTYLPHIRAFIIIMGLFEVTAVF